MSEPTEHKNNEKMILPFSIQPIHSEINKRLLKDFTGATGGFVQVGTKKYILPLRYAEEAQDFYYFETRPDDFWVLTYPRSGTTLTQELTWLVANDFDFETAYKTPLVQRFPFLEGHIQCDTKVMTHIMNMVQNDPAIETAVRCYTMSRVPVLTAATSPRFIKSHLPFSLLPPNLLSTCKAVYVARNPKDVVVSYYHHNRLFKVLGYVGNFSTYYDYFEKNLLPWSPYWEHIKEAWQLKDNPNLLFIFYEDLIKDMPRTILRIAGFLGKHPTDAQVTVLMNHLNIDNFRRNPSTNLDSEALPGLRTEGEQNFIRQGKIGGWRNEEFTPELCSRIDKWIEENLANIPDFSFPEH